MRDLLDSLRAEHEDLRLALRTLVAIAVRLASGTEPLVADAAIVLRYLREFVVGVHFAKEAATLLKGLSWHGNDEQVHAVGRILRAQAQALALLQGLILFREPAALTQEERDWFLDTSCALADCLEEGMRIEEATVFPVAGRIPADDRLAWPAICATAGHGGTRPAAAWHEDLTAVAARWPTS